jgi:hypothetical protein
MSQYSCGREFTVVVYRSHIVGAAFVHDQYAVLGLCPMVVLVAEL